MLITTIDDINKAAFAHFIAPEALVRMSNAGAFALGAIYEEKGEKLTAGVMVFSIDEGEADGEILTAAVIKWLFVDEQLRGLGVADRLIAEFIRVAGLAGVDDVICDLPMPSEYDGLCGYLESIGFEFSLLDMPELDTTLGVLFSNSRLSAQPEPGVCTPLSKLDKTELSRLYKKVVSQPNASENIRSMAEYYDRDVSCVAGENEGALLAVYRKELGLELSYFGAFDRQAKLMSDMTLFAVNAARGKYPPETPLHIFCRSGACAASMDKIFPGAQPRLVRRGYMSIYDFLKEAE